MVERDKKKRGNNNGREDFASLGLCFNNKGNGDPQLSRTTAIFCAFVSVFVLFLFQPVRHGYPYIHIHKFFIIFPLFTCTAI